MNEIWKPIPGFGGMYEINKHGEIRSWRIQGGRHKTTDRAEKPRLLRTVLRHKKDRADVLEISLYDGKKKTHAMSVKNLVRDIWMEGQKPGMVLKFMDGDPTHCDVNNLRYMTKAQANGMRHMSTRKPVAKCNTRHQKLEFYRNAVEAARKNHLSEPGMRNRIRRRTVIDGVYFKYDDED